MLAGRGQLVHIERDAHGVLEVIDDQYTRSLYFGTAARQSSMSHTDPTTLVLSYTRAMLAGLLFQPRPAEILIIGLGGGSLLRFLAHHYPEADITVVEYREAVIEIARRFFQLPEHPRIRIQHGDGTELIHNPAQPLYDLILVDAFDAVGLHPGVACEPFLQACQRRLREGGLIALNLWNTDKARCRAHIRCFEAALGQRSLRLPVEARNNLIVFGAPHLDRLPSRRSLQTTAPALKQRLGLDFPDLYRQLRRHNTLPLQWLFT